MTPRSTRIDSPGFGRGRAAAGIAAALALLVVWAPGCKRRSPSPREVEAPAASGSAAVVPEPTRCRRREDLAIAFEGAPAPSKKEPTPAEEADDDALLPFGVDIGAALPTPFGFAVSGIRGEGRAFVALFGERVSRQIELGVIHGDPETPALAAIGQRLIVALRSTDAAGYTLKLGSVGGPESGSVEWGYELSHLGKSVTGVTLATDAKQGLLVYQAETKGSSRLMLGRFAPSELTAPVKVEPLDVKDAETPRVVRRAGGYWLSWVRTLSEPKKGAGASGGRGPEDPEERELLDVGLRVIEVAKLDEHGALVGSALRVGEPRRQVLLYDVAPASGGLVIAARSDSAAPGAEDGAILLSRVGPDGSVVTERLDDDELGAGAPTLLADGEAPDGAPWLAVSAPNDTTRVGRLEGPRTTLNADPLLGRSEVIAASGERFLVQRARGRAVALEALDCRWGADSPLAK